MPLDLFGTEHWTLFIEDLHADNSCRQSKPDLCCRLLRRSTPAEPGPGSLRDLAPPDSCHDPRRPGTKPSHLSQATARHGKKRLGNRSCAACRHSFWREKNPQGPRRVGCCLHRPGRLARHAVPRQSLTPTQACQEASCPWPGRHHCWARPDASLFARGRASDASSWFRPRPGLAFLAPGALY